MNKIIIAQLIPALVLMYLGWRFLIKPWFFKKLPEQIEEASKIDAHAKKMDRKIK